MALSPKRRHWLLKAALVELGLWVARADGSVDRTEAARILHILKEWGSTRAELARLKQIGQVRLASPAPPLAALRSLRSILSREQRPIFLEALAEVAFFDQERCAAKVGRLLDVTRAMRLDQIHGLRTINEVLDRVGGSHQQSMLKARPNLGQALADLGIDRPDPVAARWAYRRLTLLYHPDRNPEADAHRHERLVCQLMRVRYAYEEVLACHGSMSAAAP